MNILIVGYGSIARKHVAAFQSLEQSFTIYALRSGRTAAEIPGVISIYSWNEVSEDIDFVIISNPTNLHLYALQQCAQRQLPVMVEKPVSNRIEGLKEVAALFEKQQIPTYVACNLRFLPVLQFLKSALSQSSKRINEVNAYCGSDLRQWRPGTDYQKSYSAQETQGGGVHLDLFHELDYLCWILGLPRVATGLNRRQSSLGINAADYAHYILQYPGFTTALTLNYYRTDPKRQLEIVFETVTWTVDLLAGTITQSDGQVIFASPNSGVADTYKAQAAHMVAVVTRNAVSLNSISDSIPVLNICLSGEKLSA